jgi:drug/metabolite transporter (DMT)-like permease
MDKLMIAILAGIALSLITVLADVFIKNASLSSGFSGWKLLVIGAIIYGLTAFGWFFVMRGAKLSFLGVLYSVIVILCLTLVSVFYFKEKLSGMEIFGIGLAISSLIILVRFA